MPQSIVGIVPERKKSDTLGLAKNPDADKPRNVQWAVDLLKGYVASGRVAVQGKGGDNLTFQVVASVLDKAISPGMCFDLLWEHWNPHCQPPWDDWDLETKIKNALKHGEDTEAGAKGFHSNEDAFAAYVGQEFEPPAPKTRDRDRIQTLHDYADNVRDPEWLIPGMLPGQGIGMIYGESGSFKSFIALDMALSLAFGIPGQWNAPPVKNDVLFMAGEGPVATGKKRWPAWMQWRDIEFRNDHRFFIKDRVPFFTDTQAWEYVKEDLALLNAKPALIVIDTLSRLLTGLDENSAKDASMITNFMEQLARYYECFVLAVHHTGKDQNKGARGSSAFYANMDTVISTKLRQGGTELRVRKQKDADVSDEISYFKVKEVAASIVLERSDDVPAETQGATKSRYAWAGVQEVLKVLQSNGGKASLDTLVQEIQGNLGIDRMIVRKQLLKSDELKFLRIDQNNWGIPTQEYDL